MTKRMHHASIDKTLRDDNHQSTTTGNRILNPATLFPCYDTRLQWIIVLDAWRILQGWYLEQQDQHEKSAGRVDSDDAHDRLGCHGANGKIFLLESRTGKQHVESRHI